MLLFIRFHSDTHAGLIRVDFWQTEADFSFLAVQPLLNRMTCVCTTSGVYALWMATVVSGQGIVANISQSYNFFSIEALRMFSVIKRATVPYVSSIWLCVARMSVTGLRSNAVLFSATRGHTRRIGG